MHPYLMTSAMPEANWRGGSVARQAVSLTTSAGGQNVPSRFLPSGRSSPVLPPMALSVWASSVVGRWAKATPRSSVDAAKPAMSPQAPPPRDTMPPSRRKPSATSRRHRDSHTSGVLARSPAGSRYSSASSPALCSAESAASPYSAATDSSAATAQRDTAGTCCRSSPPARSSAPGPI